MLLDNNKHEPWSNPELENAESKARELGMSYGKYIGLLAMREQKLGIYEKPEHIETPEERCARLYENKSNVGVYGDEVGHGRTKRGD